MDGTIVGGQDWLMFALGSSEYDQLDDCARGGGALSNDIKHFEPSVSQVVQRLSKGKPPREGTSLRTLLPWVFCRYYFSGNGVPRGWLEWCGDVLFGGCSERLHGRVALLLESDGFHEQSTFYFGSRWKCVPLLTITKTSTIVHGSLWPTALFVEWNVLWLCLLI